MNESPMITANGLANRSGLSIYTVRHYTRIGLLTPKRDPLNNYRIYQPSDEIRLRFISTAKELGISLLEIAEILREAQKGELKCSLTKKIILRQIQSNRQKIKEMKKIQKRMERASGEWAKFKNSAPDGDAIRRFVNSVGGADCP